MSREAHSVVHDVTGDPVEVWADNGAVWLLVPAGLATFDGAEQQEAFGQSFIAACNAADRQNAVLAEWGHA